MTKHFNFWLTGTGWAEATFVSDTQSITFEVSYLSDPLSDLFEALIRLLAQETTIEKIVFAQEPGEHVLMLTLQKEGNLNIEILWNDEWEELSVQQKIVSNGEFIAVNKEVVYTDSDTIVNFCSSVRNGIEQLLSRTLEEYKKQWRLYDFPSDSYSKLENQLKS